MKLPDEDLLNIQCKVESVVDVEVGRRLAGARSGLLTVLGRRLEEKKNEVKQKAILDVYKPFSPGLWYATKPTSLDTLQPRWNRLVFEIGDPLVVLRCAGWNTGIGSWWWVVDKDGHKHKILWRYTGRAFEWDKA